MKKYIFHLLLLAILPLLNAQSEKLNDNLFINEIKQGLYIISHSFPWQSNSLLVLMDNNDILLIDTPYTGNAVKEVLRWIKKKWGKPNIIAVNTHFHIDRLGGNSELIKENIKVYTSDLTIKEIREKGEKSKALLLSWITDEKIKEYYKGFVYVPGLNVFDAIKGLTLDFGEETIFVKYHGAGHSMDNLIVYLPGKKAIFAGCMILSLDTNTPGNISDGDIKQWKKTLDSIELKNYEAVIPGHGKAGGIELVVHTREVLDNF